MVDINDSDLKFLEFHEIQISPMICLDLCYEKKYVRKAEPNIITRLYQLTSMTCHINTILNVFNSANFKFVVFVVCFASCREIC